MCFSAPASFVAAAVTGSAAIIALTRVERREEVPLAVMPLFFAAQQATEGFLWLTLEASPGTGPSHLLTQLFQHFALVLWPVFAPLAVLLIEPDARRRQWISLCLAAGTVVAMYFLWSLYADPQTATVQGGHIVYSGDPDLPLAVRLLYPVATCLAPAFSTLWTIRVLATILIASSIVAYFAYWDAFSSVWCYFAAMASAVVVLHFEHAKWKRRDAVLRD